MTNRLFFYSDAQATGNGTYVLDVQVPAGWHVQSPPTVWKPVGDGSVVLNEVHYLAANAEVTNPDTGETEGFYNRIVATYTISGSTSSSFSIGLYLWAARIPSDLGSDTLGRLNLT